MSGIGYTTKAMRQARGVAKVAIVEATSVRIQVKGRIVALAENADANTLCAIGKIPQQLEQGLEAIASGNITMSTQNTQVTIKGWCMELQTKQNQYQPESQQQ